MLLLLFSFLFFFWKTFNTGSSIDCLVHIPTGNIRVSLSPNLQFAILMLAILAMVRCNLVCILICLSRSLKMLDTFLSHILKRFPSLFLDITMDFIIPFINKLIYFSLCIFHLQLFICCQYYDIIFEELVKITHTLECSSLLW